MGHRASLSAVAGLLLALAAAGETFVWVDAQGVTHVTDDPSAVPPEARERLRDSGDLSDLWDGVVAEPAAPTEPDGARGSSERIAGPGRGAARDRTARLIRGAAEDIDRGENARAAAALESVLRQEPSRPEAHWYLAHLDRARGRYDSAAGHLRAFLGSAGDDLEPWRAEAEERLRRLDDERRLADTSVERGPGRFLAVDATHFRVSYDSDLGRASPDYARTVLGYLERAREAVGARLGAVPQEPMGVVFYGKAAYLRAHRHRFSFQTVGFFDGRIHVVSAAHPAEELRDLLFHEYAHAIFREQTGGDRPFWLNEGLAELSERDGLSSDGLTRSERVSLHIRISEGDWIPLRRLAPSFSGLTDADARAAYLEATAAAAWIESQTDRAQRGHLLALLGQGLSDDEALKEVLGLDTDGVDAAVRESIRSRFPVLAF